ncbi:unnamed protein product, partial [Rotaria magnacalcarata]
MVDSVHQSVPK